MQSSVISRNDARQASGAALTGVKSRTPLPWQKSTIKEKVLTSVGISEKV